MTITKKRNKTIEVKTESIIYVDSIVTCTHTYIHTVTGQANLYYVILSSCEYNIRWGERERGGVDNHPLI